MEVTASAPGKVFLLGEYAVAVGLPAVVAAVDRRLGCRLRSRRGVGRVDVRCAAESFAGSLDAETLDGVPPGCRFVTAAVLVSARRLGLRDVDIDVRTWSDLDPGGPKVGLGGSAAAVASVTAAVHALAGRVPEDLRVLASVGIAAHRLAQGSGSGADVVASTLGGIAYVSGLDACPAPRTVSACQQRVALEAETLGLPAGLSIEVVGTGESAATGPRVARFVDRFQDRRGAPGGGRVLGAWSEAMGAAAASFAAACRAGDREGALRAVAAARRLLDRLGALAGLRLWTERLREACAALDSDPAVQIKPSGAGGGDCAVALVASQRRAALREAWRRAGLHPIEVEASLQGVIVERSGAGAPRG